MATQKRKPTILREITGSADPLETLCRHDQLTPAGCAWLKTALDPFHDYEVPDLGGYPDMLSEPSVVIVANQSMEISKDPSLAAGTWDCHIATSQLLFEQTDSTKPNCAVNYQARKTTGSGPLGVLMPPSASGVPRMDGCIAWQVASGERTFDPSNAVTAFHVDGLHLDQYLTTDDTHDSIAYRCIASGFEVVNTTAAINRQGSVTCYEFDPACTSTNVNFVKAGSPDLLRANISACIMAAPPGTVGAAKQFHSSHTWNAEDGAYCVAKLNSMQNPAQREGCNAWVMISDAGTSSFPNSISSAVGETAAIIPGSGTGDSDNISACSFTKFGTSGAYFTGLSEETTLTVTWRCVLERVPSSVDRAMQALARPSPVLDNVALTLYSQMLHQMPPGVPQNYNDFGKWFRMASKVAKNVIPKALPWIGGAVGSVLAPGEGTALGTSAGTALANIIDGGSLAKELKKVANGNKKKKAVPVHGPPKA